MKTAMFKTFFTVKVPAFVKSILNYVKSIPAIAKSGWAWVKAFCTVSAPAFIKNLCGSIRAFITPVAVK